MGCCWRSGIQLQESPSSFFFFFLFFPFFLGGGGCRREKNARKMLDVLVPRDEPTRKKFPIL